MTFDPTSESRLAFLEPEFVGVLRQLETNILAAHPEVKELLITQGMRSSVLQLATYMQGRASLGDVNALRAKAQLAPISEEENVVVTPAPPGESWHEFGMAADVAPLMTEGDIDWNSAHPIWQDIIAEGERLGLISGNQFPNHDDPHFQRTGRFPWTPDAEVRILFAKGGCAAVWAGSKQPVVA